MYSRNRRPHTLSDDGWKAVSVYLATSADRKARYLKDFKPFSSVFTLQNVGLQTGKAIVVALNLVMLDANKHDIDKNMHPDKKLPDFDWEMAIRKHLKTFQDLLIRYCSVSVIKKSLEEAAMMKLSVRLVDKLTKDVWQSLARKSAKFGHSVACQKIFFTSFHGNALFNAANCIYDIVHAGILHLYSCFVPSDNSNAVVKRGAVEPLKALGYIANRLTYYSLLAVSSAAGYSAGSFFNEKYGGFVGSLTTELIAALLLANLPTSF